MNAQDSTHAGACAGQKRHTLRSTQVGLWQNLSTLPFTASEWSVAEKKSTCTEAQAAAQPMQQQCTSWHCSRNCCTHESRQQPAASEIVLSSR